MAKKKKKTVKNEVRYNKHTKHFDYVFEDDGNRYTSFGITHHDKTFGIKNMPLKQNPQMNHTEQAFVRNGKNRSPHKNYGKVKNNFAFSNEDFANVKAKVRNTKKNSKKRKKNK